MLDITADHIQELDDEDLRDLIARLCEAEASAGGHSPLNVTSGGHQNSTDGGIDVRVALDRTLSSASNLPRFNCGFQVKAEDMQPVAIVEEMKPDGRLRQSIRDLATHSGAYIIVSSQGSVSDTALKRRRNAMAEAMRECAEADQLLLDFYDRTRIATWVREHPGIILWVLEKTGRSISGWKSHGDWATSQEPADAPYLVDEKLRIQSLSMKQSASAEQGISMLRGLLGVPRSVVRLVGLSGTGKTRLVQALFESNFGTDALNRASAVYCNLSDNPSPQPIAMASDLIALGKRAVLVVDNCQPDLHRRLADTCRTPGSSLSLITVEYDVREDQPEGTDVFELRSSSNTLLKALLKRRHNHIADVNLDVIVGLSDGNARVALALASTVRPGELLAELRDEEVFTRLFQQRHAENAPLLQSAQACSLAYSFQGEDISSAQEAELWRLAEPFGLALRIFYADLAELSRRNLLQKRGVWRALLPHAIANRFAALALQNLAPEELRRFVEQLPSRLLRSFSRRLGYLHRSEQARQLVSGWLASGGLLGRIEALDDLHIQILVNVAPVAPRAVLQALHEAAEREMTQGRVLDGPEIRMLLHSLAFDPDYFDDAFLLLTERVSASEEIHRFDTYTKSELSAMFQIYLSGTHASVEQRIQAIERLLIPNNERLRQVGFACLSALLKTSYFVGQQKFDFGARSRDYGYWPDSQQAIVHWYSSALAFCERADAINLEISMGVRKVLAEHLRALWTESHFHDETEALCRTFAERRFWPEGWIKIRSIRKFRKEPITSEEEERLTRMEAMLQPQTPQERFRVLVLRRAGSVWEDHGYEDWEAQSVRLDAAVNSLGKEVAQSSALLEELLPETFTAEVSSGLLPFALGLFQGGCPLSEIWNRAEYAFANIDPSKRNVEFFASLISVAQQGSPSDVEAMLASSFNSPELRPSYPYLQSRVPVDAAGLMRLEESLAMDYAPVGSFRNLGHSTVGLTDEQLAHLLPFVTAKPGGFVIALDFICIRIILSERDGGDALSENILSLGRQLLAEQSFREAEGAGRIHPAAFDQHQYEEVARHCLAAPEGAGVTRKILQRIDEAQHERGFLPNYIGASFVVATLAAVQPIPTLDYLFSRRRTEEDGGMDYMLDRDHTSALDQVPQELLLEWCDKDAAPLRFQWVAANLCFFSTTHDTDKREWKPVARLLLERAPERTAIIKHFLAQLRPGSWSGSYALTYASNLALFENFTWPGDHALESFVRAEHERMHLHVERLKLEEEREEAQRNETFE